MSPGAFIATCTKVFADLRWLFPAFPQGPVARAVVFGVLVSSVGAAVLMIPPLMTGSRYAAFSAAFMVAASVPSVFLSGFSLYICQKVFRGRGTLAMCLRASGYLAVLSLAMSAGLILPTLVGVPIFLGMLFLSLWASKLLLAGRAGLTSGQGWTASVLAMIVATVIGTCVAFVPATFIGMVFGEIPIPDGGE